MKLLDPSDLPAWEGLLSACNAYGHFTGGRYVADDFAGEGGRSSRDMPGFEEARLEAADAVATYKLLVTEPDETLLEQYRQAYALTVHEAAIATMVATLRALELLPQDGMHQVDDVTVHDARQDDLATLAAKIAAADATRKASDRSSNVKAARLRAASFVADFGAAAGLERVACRDDDELLKVFHAKLDDIAASDDTAGQEPPRKKVDRVMRDAFAPYADLFSAGNLDEARDWCKTHPEEVSTVAAVGAVAVGIGIALFGLLRSSRSSRPRL